MHFRTYVDMNYFLSRIPSSGMLRRVAHIVYFRSVLRLLVTANVVANFTHSCQPDDGEATFLRNVGTYKSHTAELMSRKGWCLLGCYAAWLL
jgi:hypothetical protein